MMKQNTYFKGDGDSCIDLLITNSKFSFMTINLKLVWVITIIYTILKTKLENFEPEKLIYRNFKQNDSDQFKLDMFNSMDAMRTHAVFKNNFVSILDKRTPRKKFFFRENQKPHFNKNLREQMKIRSHLQINSN